MQVQLEYVSKICSNMFRSVLINFLNDTTVNNLLKGKMSINYFNFSIFITWCKISIIQSQKTFWCFFWAFVSFFKLESSYCRHCHCRAPCVQQKNERHTGLIRQEGEKWWQNGVAKYHIKGEVCTSPLKWYFTTPFSLSLGHYSETIPDLPAQAGWPTRSLNCHVY